MSAKFSLKWVRFGRLVAGRELVDRIPGAADEGPASSPNEPFDIPDYFFANPNFTANTYNARDNTTPTGANRYLQEQFRFFTGLLDFKSMK